MANVASWRQYLQGRFPAYLLPESAAHTVPLDEARRFLERITGRPDALELVRGASFFASRAHALSSFLVRILTPLVSELSSMSIVERREWTDGYRGRVHVGETAAARARGRVTATITLSRRRTFHLPENILIRALCDRLLSELVRLRSAGVLRDEVGWGAPLRGCEGRLRGLLLSAGLRDLPTGVRSDSFEVAATRGTRDKRYWEVLRWWRELKALDDPDPARLAELLRTGALLPLDDSTCFELAASIRLAEQLAAALELRSPETWRLERGLVHARRKDIFSLHSARVSIRVYYNQAVLPAGETDTGVRHYLASSGRLRPDIVVTFEVDDQLCNAVVFECKHSDDSRVLDAGFREAALYRAEYKASLHLGIKAILVASSPVSGPVRPTDDVVAVDWEHFPPERLIAELTQHASDLCARARL